MKRLLGLLTLVLMLVMTACSSPVDITPGKIDVVYDNPRFEGTSIVVDVWITNGTDTDEYIESVDFWFELPDGTEIIGYEEGEVCGAQFDIFEAVPSDDYRDYELEFTSEFIYLTESELNEVGVTLDDLEFYFLIDPVTDS